MQYILSTVGLSILTNGLRGKIDTKEIYANSNAKELEESFSKKFESVYKDLLQRLQTSSTEQIKRLSAELNALLSYNRFETSDVHRLLCTDTYLGKKAADLLKNYLSSQGLNVSIYTPTDLKTDDIESFHIALADMAKELSEEIEGYRRSGYEIVFNLTGGFKSVNSFLQTMASLYADKSLYIFETSYELLTIPRIPVKVDESIFKDNVQLFRALELGLDVEYEKLNKLPKTLILKIGDEYTLSAWGAMVWQKFKQTFYTKELVEPIGPIVYSEQFKKDFQKLSPVEKMQLNQKIDLLERYIAYSYNPSSLRYHALSGSVAQKYSHEFYPFDGNDSRRAYCNEKENTIIIEKIDSHLK